MSKPTGPAPVAVVHASHAATLLNCPGCRRASENTFPSRLSTLRARR